MESSILMDTGIILIQQPERWHMELLIFRIMMMPVANGYIMILSPEECSMGSSILTVTGIILIQLPERWRMENITVTVHITITTQ